MVCERGRLTAIRTMGSDAEIFLFDFKAYQQEIVPLFHHFMLTGQAPGSLWKGKQTYDTERDRRRLRSYLQHN